MNPTALIGQRVEIGSGIEVPAGLRGQCGIVRDAKRGHCRIILDPSPGRESVQERTAFVEYEWIVGYQDRCAES